MKELDDPNAEIKEQGRSRKSGGGRKPVWEGNPKIICTLENLVSAHTKGDPMSSLIWTNKSLRSLEMSLKEQGFEVCYQVVGITTYMGNRSGKAGKRKKTPPKGGRNKVCFLNYLSALIAAAI